jgi:glucokinase
MRLVLGADVGGTHLRLGLFDAEGWHLLWQGKRGWRGQDDSPESLAAALLASMREAEAATGHALAELPLGMGLAAQLSPDGRTVVNGPNLGWRDVAFADRLEAALGRPVGSVAVCNDLSAIVMGELAAGAAVGVRSLVALYAGTGVGGAAVVEGRLVRGTGGTAGEVGHMKLPGGQAPCGCGEVGCVESVAGGASLGRRLQGVQFATDVAGELPGDPARLERAAVAGEAEAERIVAEVVDALAYAASGLCTFLNPEVLLVGGGLLERAPVLAARFEARTMELTLAVARARLTIRRGSLGDEAGLLGAAHQALQRLV